MQSFIAVTGPKEDLWLVRVVGVLVLVLGAVLWHQLMRLRSFQGARFAGALSAAALGIADVVAWATGAVGPIYLADAALQALLLAGWLLAGPANRTRSGKGRARSGSAPPGAGD